MPQEEEYKSVSSDKIEDLNTWNKLFLETTNPKFSTGRLIHAFIQRELYSFNMGNRYSVSYILSEVYIRGYEKITANKEYEISNIAGWIKGVSFRYIRELSRAKEANNLPFTECTQESPSEEEDDSYDCASDIQALRQAIAQLSSQQQRLLRLKVVESKSWSEIRTVMRVEGYGDWPEATWRKRKERALSALRKDYHKIKPPF